VSLFGKQTKFINDIFFLKFEKFMVQKSNISKMSETRIKTWTRDNSFKFTEQECNSNISHNTEWFGFEIIDKAENCIRIFMSSAQHCCEDISIYYNGTPTHKIFEDNKTFGDYDDHCRGKTLKIAAMLDDLRDQIITDVSWGTKDSQRNAGAKAVHRTRVLLYNGDTVVGQVELVNSHNGYYAHEIMYQYNSRISVDQI
jgi:hypothetical protein